MKVIWRQVLSNNSNTRNSSRLYFPKLSLVIFNMSTWFQRSIYQFSKVENNKVSRPWNLHTPKAGCIGNSTKLAGSPIISILVPRFYFMYLYISFLSRKIQVVLKKYEKNMLSSHLTIYLIYLIDRHYVPEVAFNFSRAQTYSSKNRVKKRHKINGTS